MARSGSEALACIRRALSRVSGDVLWGSGVAEAASVEGVASSAALETDRSGGGGVCRLPSDACRRDITHHSSIQDIILRLPMGLEALYNGGA